MNTSRAALLLGLLLAASGAQAQITCGGDDPMCASQTGEKFFKVYCAPDSRCYFCKYSECRPDKLQKRKDPVDLLDQNMDSGKYKLRQDLYVLRISKDGKAVDFGVSAYELSLAQTPGAASKKPAPTPAPAAGLPSWTVREEPWDSWRVVNFTDERGKNRELWCPRSECAPSKKQGQAKLYVFTHQRSEAYTYREHPWDLFGRTSSKATYATTLSSYALDLAGNKIFVPGTAKAFPAEDRPRYTPLGYVLRVLPPTARADDAPLPMPKPATPVARKPGSPATRRPASPAGPATEPVSKPSVETGAPTTPPNGAAPESQPQFAAEAKDQSEQFAPYMTADELATYKANLHRKTGDALLEYNKQQLAIIAGRRPYPDSQTITRENFAGLEGWQQKRFCREALHRNLSAPPKKPAPRSDGNALNDTKTCDTQGAEGCAKLLEGGSNRTPSDSFAINLPQDSPAGLKALDDACREALQHTEAKDGGIKKDKKDEVPALGVDKGASPTKPNPLLAPALLMEATKGALIGALIGAGFGPPGILVGALIGAAVFYVANWLLG